jgi:zinc protease
MKAIAAVLGLLAASMAWGDSPGGARVAGIPSKSPLVTVRAVFLTGAAYDPAGKPGLAALTAAMLAGGGTREMTYRQIVDAMYPMATSVASQTDKEMISFTAATHVDNLEAFYKIFRAMLLDPGWREDDFTRLRDDAINFLKVSLRGNNDEELGKEALYNLIYAGHPYGHHDLGTVSSLEKLTLADVRDFYRSHFTQGNLILGIAGGYPPDFPERMKHDFANLPEAGAAPVVLPQPKPLAGNRVLLIQKDTRSVAISLGFPIDVKRGDPDYAALLVMQSYFGQHRMSGGLLYQQMREMRGLNYGDYAYLEYFPRGMYQLEPSPNLARRQQIFQIWIRPVEPPTAHFALRLALFELNKLIEQGMPQESFERTRLFLAKYVNLMTKTKTAELGYAIDSLFYGIPDYNRYVKDSLAKLTLEDVNRAIRKHLRADNLDIVIVAKDCEGLKRALLADEPSPMKYNSAKPQAILDEDKIVEKWKIGLAPDAVTVAPAERIFE